MTKAIEQQRTLSVKQITQKNRHTKRVRTSFTVICQLVTSIIAIDLCILLYWYLAPWPIYRIVSFIVVFILWSNIASITMRTKTKKQAQSLIHTVSTRAVKKLVLNEDTTIYLVALKSKAIKGHYANIKTDLIQRIVSHDDRDHRLVHRTKTTPVR